MHPSTHIPTDSTRAEVSALISFGITQEDIAKYVGVDQSTLAKYYRREIDTAVIRANAQVANKLFRKAVEQDDLSAQIFWLKTRGRWKTADNNTTNNLILIKHEDAIKELA